MHTIELNSPAGNIESVKSAVYNGANAVYLGMRMFNARRMADNFSLEELKQIIKFCHLHNVKVYLAMNTLVKNPEIELWFKSLESAYLAGIDAVIIQNLWLAPLIKKFFPDLKIHASTQSSLMNYHGINFFEEQNLLDSVVLARELSSKEISGIRKCTKVNLEIFVHGHLCISYSGQCLISSLIGKRSGNRGICASSCRKEYNMQGFLISPKDLMLANKISEIYKLGINSVKIEGRMKSPEYVAITTKIYRKQIDSAVNGKTKPLSNEQVEKLKMGFNREFTDGFFSGNKSIVGSEMPMNRGISLGTVRYHYLKLEADINLLDGIGIWNPDNRGKMEGFILKELIMDSQKVESAKKGDIVKIPSRHFKNSCKVFLTSKYNEEDFSTNLNFFFEKISLSGEEGKPLKITGKNFELLSEIPFQKAEKNPLQKSDIDKEFSKSEHLGIKYDMNQISLGENLFMPFSVLRKLRQNLEETIFSRYIPQRTSNFSESKLPSIENKIIDTTPKLIVKVYSVEQLIEAVNAGVFAVYFDIFSEQIKKAKEFCKNTKFFLDTPVIMTDNDIIRAEKIIEDVKPDGICVGNWGMLKTKFQGEKHGKYSLNVFNDIDVLALRSLKILPMVSPELSAEELEKFHNKEFIYYAHGRIPVMHFKGVYPQRNLTDEKMYSFPMRVVNYNTEMLYSRPIAVYENVLELARSGIKYFFLDLEIDTATIINAYNNIIDGKKQDISMLKKGTTLGNFEKIVA